MFGIAFEDVCDNDLEDKRCAQLPNGQAIVLSQERVGQRPSNPRLSASGRELPGIYAYPARSSHAQPARKVDHVTQGNQPGAMGGGYRLRRAINSAVTDRK